MRRFLFLVVLLLLHLSLHSQDFPYPECGIADPMSEIEIFTQTNSGVTVCEGSLNLQTEIENVSDNSNLISNIQVNILLPKGVEYVSQSISGGTIVETTEDEYIDNRRLIRVDLPNSLSPAEKAIITYTVEAYCPVLQLEEEIEDEGEEDNEFLVRSEIWACYLKGSSTFWSKEEFGTGSLNIYYPNLQVVVPEEQENLWGTTGDIVERDISVRNVGDGVLDMSKGFTFYIDEYIVGELESVSISASSPGVSGIVLDTVERVGGRTVHVTGTGTLDPSERILITERVKVNTCLTTMAREYRASWGCSDEECIPISSNNSTIAYINTPDELYPSISATLGNNISFDFCAGEKKTVHIIFANDGETESNAIYAPANKARDIVLRWITSSATSTDFIVDNLEIRHKDGHWVAITQAEYPEIYIASSSGPYLYFRQTLQTDIDGPGYGLEDLDGEGFYDDLAVGDEIEIRGEVTMNGCPFDSGFETVNQYYTELDLQYFNACKTGGYKYSEDKQYRLYFPLHSYDINGEIDLLVNKPEIYSFSLNRSRYFPEALAALNISEGTYKSYITVPPGVVVDESQDVLWENNVIDPNSISQDGNVITINGGSYSGTLDVPLKLICDGEISTFGPADVHWQMVHTSQSGGCSCDQVLVDTEYEIYVHRNRCEPGGPCGLVTESFEVARTTLGYKQPSASGFNYYTAADLLEEERIDPASANTHLGLEYDELDATVIASMPVGASSIDNAHIRIKYLQDPSINENIFELIGAEVILNPDGSNITLGSSNTFPEEFTLHEGSYKSDLYLDLSNGTSTIEPGDEVKVIAKLRILNNDLSPGPYPLKRLRAEYRHILAPGDTVVCESFGDKFTFIQKEITEEASSYISQRESCTMTRHSRISITGGGHDDFGNEFRPLGGIQSFTYTVPEDMYYVPGSLKIRVRTDNEHDNSYVEVPVSDAGIVAADQGSISRKSTASNPLVLSFPRQPEWPVSGSYGNSSWYEWAVFDVRADCQPEGGIYTDSYTDSKTDGVYSVYDYVDGLNKQDIPGVTYIRERDYRNATHTNPIEFSADQTQEGFSSTVIWPVYLCNVNDATPNVWFRLKPRETNEGSVTIQSVIDDDDNNYLFEYCDDCEVPGTYLILAGDLNPGDCRKLNITATYTGCEASATDTLDVYGSWTCGAAPDINELDNPSCMNPSTGQGYSAFTGELYLKYKSAGMAMTVDADKPEAELCDPVTYTVSLTGNSYADMNEVSLKVQLPEGVRPYPDAESFASFSYPADKTVQNDLTSLTPVAGEPTNGKSQTIYEFPLFPQLNAEYDHVPAELPGGRVFENDVDTDDFDNKIILYYTVISECPAFDQAYPIIFIPEGKNNCQEPLPIDEIQRKIKRLNFTPDSMALSFTRVDNGEFTSCGSEVTLRARVENTEDIATAYENELQVIVPPGVTYGTGADNEIPDSPEAGYTTLTWAIPAGMAPGAALEKTFTASLGLGYSSSEDVLFTASTTITSEAFCSTSDTSDCELETSTGFGEVAVPVSINEPIVTITVPEDPVCAGEPFTLSSTITYEDGNNPGTHSCSWSGAGLSSSTSCSPTVNPTETATYTLTVSYGGTCYKSVSEEVTVIPSGSIDVTESRGVSCAGNSDGWLRFIPTASEGTPDLTVNLYKGSTLEATSNVESGTEEVFTSLAQGSYVLEFIDPVGNCLVRQSATIGDDSPRINNLCSTVLLCDESQGNSTFSFTAFYPYVDNSGTYSWQLMHNGIPVSDINGTSSFSGSYAVEQEVTFPVSSGEVYTVSMIDDGSGCPASRSTSAKSLEYQVSVDPDHKLCYVTEQREVPFYVSNNFTCGEKASGVEYTYQLYRENAETSVMETYGDPIVSSEDKITYDLGMGKYEITVDITTTSHGNCHAFTELEMTGASTFTVDIEPNAPRCAGTSTASAEAVINGGYSFIQYSWKNMATGEIVSTTSTAEGLDPGTSYGLWVRDGHGCQDDYYHEFEFPEGPPALDDPVITDDPACDATATVPATSGTPGYSFTWYYITDEVAGTKVMEYHDQPEGNTSHATDLQSGLYEVVVTDANGCTSSATGTVTRPDIPMTYDICMGWATQPTRLPLSDPEPPEPPESTDDIVDVLDNKVNRCIARQVELAKEEYTRLCTSGEFINDELLMNYEVRYEHFTLYYYDRGGRLVKTVPPEGVNLVLPPARDVTPAHELATTYEYNSLGQITSQSTPDGGITDFLYNNTGQLRYSQNARQAEDDQISYSNYDALGRITEVGESRLAGGEAFTALDVESFYESTESEENTYTVYTTPAGWISYQGSEQRHLRNRVSYSYTINEDGRKEYTYYSYDAHGNVEWLVQQAEGFAENTVAYRYDLISGR